MTGRQRTGRPRSAALDDAILTAARDVLVESGPNQLTFAEVAARAGTTRPALYRRFGDLDELAVAAVASFGAATTPKVTGHGLTDLVAELRSFRRGITTTHGIALAGAVLAETTSARVAEAYRASVVAPRRTRLRAILDRAAHDGTITADERDRHQLVTMCTGSWYAHALAGERPPKDWPDRTALMVWTAAGGHA
ncbi:MAG: TetR/AcrR family transcriptional regulator [Actinomycetota bacterium]